MDKRIEEYLQSLHDVVYDYNSGAIDRVGYDQRLSELEVVLNQLVKDLRSGGAES